MNHEHICGVVKILFKKFLEFLSHPKMKVNRLTIIAVNLALGVSLVQEANAQSMTKGQPLVAFTPQLKSGDYVWFPEISPTGPVVIIVSLQEQLLYVYRNGVRIGRTTISSGKQGHRTPTGVFTILEKNVKHTSTLFRGASMPYMERLTWRGVAMHAGNLPGYPASHGCVRMPLEFSKKLYAVTENGTSVIITDSKFEAGISEPGFLFSAGPGEEAIPGSVVWNPGKANTGPVSIIVSSADQSVHVYRNGIEIGQAPFVGMRKLNGSYVYSALATVDSEGRHDWISASIVGGQAPDLKEFVKQAKLDSKFLSDVRALITAGSTLILTNTPVNVSSQSGAGFKILTSAAAR